jgi:mRNA interferase MazF
MGIIMQRGDIVVCVLNGDHGKPRPAVIVQADAFNKTHATLTICPFTTHLIEASLFRLLISPTKQNGLQVVSQIMIDKITSLKRDKIHQKVGSLTVDQIKKLDDALLLWLDLNNNN